MDKMIQTGYGSLHTHIEGSGPPILLIHGYHPESTWHLWEHNVQALANAGFTVYALDMLGYGESEGDQADYHQQAKALLDLIEAEGLATVTVGGVSWGGMIALEVALSAPARDSAGAGHFSEDELETISCPALIVWGEDDSVIPLANAAWFGAAIPNSQVEIIPDVTDQEGVPPWGGHHPMRYKPAEFNHVVIDFLTGD
jgi:pimeloyl-ACP methyl ester carboxylesterase